jgi:hypothetical protein
LDFKQGIKFHCPGQVILQNDYSQLLNNFSKKIREFFFTSVSKDTVYRLAFTLLLHLTSNKKIKMSNSQNLIAELEHELISTGKLLELVPAELIDFKPNPRAMTLGQLANHVAVIPVRYLTFAEEGFTDL